MRRAITALIGCLALASIAGCGSSSSSTGSAAGAPSTSSAAATSTGSSLKSTTAPKYGTPSPSSPVQSGTVSIAYRNIAISPDTVRVKAGSTIKWTNFDPTPHNVTSQGGPQKFTSKDFSEKGTFSIKATTPGVIHYLCSIHPASMNGTIEVLR